MLRDSEDNTSSGFCCLKHLLKDNKIFIDVLQDIKGTHYIKLLFKGNLPGVHLKERNIGQPLLRIRQAVTENITSI